MTILNGYYIVGQFSYFVIMMLLVTLSLCTEDSLATDGLSAHQSLIPKAGLTQRALAQHRTVETAGSNNSQKMLSARLSHIT